jgi:hypothetical protein
MLYVRKETLTALEKTVYSYMPYEAAYVCHCRRGRRPTHPSEAHPCVEIDPLSTRASSDPTQRMASTIGLSTAL